MRGVTSFEESVKVRMEDVDYYDGYQAFLAGGRMKAPKSAHRLSWYDGYLDAKYPETKYRLPLCKEENTPQNRSLPACASR